MSHVLSLVIDRKTSNNGSYLQFFHEIEPLQKHTQIEHMQW
jgi:hypothetical protein